MSAITTREVQKRQKHWLPNFWECWWDHLFLDLFGCNLIGIILGYYTLKYSSASKINWVYDPKSVKSSKQGTVPKEEPCSNVVYNFFDKFKP